MMHPALKFDFAVLFRKLLEEAEEGNIRIFKDEYLLGFNYTPQCVFSGAWNEFTCSARGLILDTRYKKIVALPFPKFFNLSENKHDPELLAKPFEVFEKLDGSLLICFYDTRKNIWRVTTRGSFHSEQAQLGKILFDRIPQSQLNADLTYLFELVGPSNKIVVNYLDDELVLIGAYDTFFGEERDSVDLEELARYLGVRCAPRHQFNSISEMIHIAENSLTKDQEGFVVKFCDGSRIKIKGSQYLQIHRMISNLSPISVWEIMKDNPEQLMTLEKELPEEFRDDFQNIFSSLQTRVKTLLNKILEVYEKTKNLSDKELGLIIKTLPEPERNFIFAWRKSSSLLEGKGRQAIFRAIRPDRNCLEGYTPSSAMNRVVEETIT